MNKEQQLLFEKILSLAMRGKLVLWAGAGLSMEAGYPSGWGLSQILWDKLSNTEKYELQPISIEECNTSLSQISDYYINNGAKGKNSLLEILKEVFDKDPKHSESHEIIQKFAIIKTLITTNYDGVFEKTIPSIEVIRSAKDLARTKANSRKLIKIHGDLKEPKRIILTESDYSRLYSKNNSDPFWSKINVELTEKAVLFIGYGFNDGNVRNHIEMIQKKLKKHTLPKYLVAPRMSKAEQLKLKSYDIKYIDSEGIDFLRNLYEVWKLKGFRYFGMDEVPIDDLIQTFGSEGIALGITPKKGGGRFISFNPEPNMDKAFNLTFKFQNPDLERRITDWRRGLGSDELVIKKKDVEIINLKISDIVIGDKSTLSDYRFIRRGNQYNDIRIFFEDSGIEMERLSVRTHPYESDGLKIIVSNQDGHLEILIPEMNETGFPFSTTFKPKEPINSINGLLKWHEAIHALATGESFMLYSEDLPQGYRHPSGTASKNLEDISRNRLIFQVLKKVEDKFKVRFHNLKEKDIFNNDVLAQLQSFLELFNFQKINQDISKGLPLKNMENERKEKIFTLVEEAKKEGGFLIFEDEPNIVILLDRKINLGKKQMLIEKPLLVRPVTEKGTYFLKSENDIYFVMYDAFGLLNENK